MSPKSNNDTSRFEDALKNALRRQEAPDGFADRVLARGAEQNSTQNPVHHHSWLRLFAQPALRWAMFAAVSTAMILGAYLYNVRRERAEGQAAKQRLMLALRIAGSKLQLARSKITQINAENPEEKE